MLPALAFLPRSLKSLKLLCTWEHATAQCSKASTRSQQETAQHADATCSQHVPRVKVRSILNSTYATHAAVPKYLQPTRYTSESPRKVC